MQKTCEAVDLYCGGGGTTTGFLRAAKKRDLKVKLTAINHWDVAIATHKANHEFVDHRCTNLDEVDPRSVVPSGKLDLLLASPECIFFSRARGGKPIDDQKRASVFTVMRWLEVLYVRTFIIENVPELRDWGPLNASGRPIKKRKGEAFRAYITQLRSLGYTVEYRVLNCADYGAPTLRKRLFIIGRRGNFKPVWPEATHAAPGLGVVAGKKPWRVTREIIDWSVKGKNIFDLDLAETTWARIVAGMERFGGEDLKPFLVHLRGTSLSHIKSSSSSIDAPAPTLTASGEHLALIEPLKVSKKVRFIVPHRTFKNMNVDSVDVPLRTVTGHSSDHALVEAEAFLINAGGPEVNPRSVDSPMNTVLTRDHMALVQPFLVSVAHGDNKPGSGRGNGGRTRSVDRPMPTVTASGRDYGLVEPVCVSRSIVPFYGERAGQTPRSHSVDAPLPTVPTTPQHGLAEAFIIPLNHGKEKRAYGMDEPMRTVSGVDAWALITKYYGTGQARPVTEPLGTVTTNDRFGLVTIGDHALDIRFRMLMPHELAGAQGFAKDYVFKGTRRQKVKQIGNAVPPDIAEALCEANL